MTIGNLAFNGFDIVVLLVLAISALMAMGRGLFRELISIVALIVGLAVSLFIWGRFRFAVQDFISPAWLADGALALGSFSIAYMLVIFALGSVSKSLTGKGIGPLDRMLGAAFGGLRGLVVMALFVMIPTAAYRDAQDARNMADKAVNPEVREFLQKDVPELPDWLQTSLFYPILERIGDGIRALPFADIESAADQLRRGETPDAITDRL